MFGDAKQQFIQSTASFAFLYLRDMKLLPQP